MFPAYLPREVRRRMREHVLPADVIESTTLEVAAARSPAAPRRRHTHSRPLNTLTHPHHAYLLRICIYRLPPLLSRSRRLYWLFSPSSYSLRLTCVARQPTSVVIARRYAFSYRPELGEVPEEVCGR
jgi:hypothetical protein